VVRLDRGWSTVLLTNGDAVRVRNIGVEVAVGDEVNVSADLERVHSVSPRRSALVRRASFEGARAQRQVVASNIDTVFLVHSLTSPPNERRLERELVLAFDSGADPVIVPRWIVSRVTLRSLFAMSCRQFRWVSQSTC